MKDKESAEDAHAKLLAMWHGGSAGAAGEKKAEKKIYIFDNDSILAAAVVASLIMWFSTILSYY
jgi:hypothetical protein